MIEHPRIMLALAFACAGHACASAALPPPAATTGAPSIAGLSIAALAGSVWTLRAWDISEPAEPEPVVTLTYDGARFSGSSGCNRYLAGVEGGPTPGAVKVGPLAGTRMACPEPQSTVEARFLKQLGAASTFGFMAGRLSISYARSDGSTGTMLFDAIPHR